MSIWLQGIKLTNAAIWAVAAKAMWRAQAKKAIQT